MPKSSKRLAAILFLLTLLSDQVSKTLVVKNLSLGESLDVCSFFNIVRVQNRGITFGLFNGRASSEFQAIIQGIFQNFSITSGFSGEFQPIIFILISLAIVLVLIYQAKKYPVYILPTSLIVGGAIGNVIDRIIYKSVIDFLDFHVGSYHWPAFNIADSAIMVGVFVMCWISYLEDNHEKFK